VIFKGGEVLEKAFKVNTVVFDKTGTVTNGKPDVKKAHILDKTLTEVQLFAFVGSAESGSEHPLGKALYTHTKTLNCIINTQLTDFVNMPGMGVVCTVDLGSPRKVAVGNVSLMKNQNIQIPKEAKHVMKQMRKESFVAICVALDNKLVSLIALADTPKKEAKIVISELKSRNIEVWMISGDDRRTAKRIAKAIGINNVLGNVLPADKANKIKDLQKEGKIVAMVGDGVNDSVALVQADVGIAVGTGTDIALEAADVILMKNDLQDVIFALDLSQVVFRRIKLNFLWAFFYNLFAIPIAAGILYPWFGIAIPPALAGLSEILSSLPVILFSIAIKYHKWNKLLPSEL